MDNQEVASAVEPTPSVAPVAPAPAVAQAIHVDEPTLRASIEADITRVQGTMKHMVDQTEAHIASLRAKMEHVSLQHLIDRPLSEAREFFKGLAQHFS